MKKLLGISLGAVSAISYGTNPLFAVPLLRVGFPVDSMIFWRLAGGAVFLIILAFCVDGRVSLSKRQIFWTAVLGFLFALSAESLFYAFTMMSAGVASTMLFLYPIFVAVIMAFFGERIAKSIVAAIITALCGVAVLGLGDMEGAAFSVAGGALVILSALTYALYMVVVKVTSVSKAGGLTLTAYVMAFATVFMLFKCLCSGTLALPASNAEILNICGLILIPSALSITAISYAIKYAGATITAILGALEPATAVAISVVFLGEEFTVCLGIGICLIILAVVILSASNARKKSAV